MKIKYQILKIKDLLKNFKFYFVILLSTFYFLLFHAPSPSQTIKASTTDPCKVGTPTRAEGLISATDITATSKFYRAAAGACLVGTGSIYAPFKAPSFQDLLSLYYDRSKKVSLKKTDLPKDSKFSEDGLYKISGDLKLDKNPTGTGEEVIFVLGNLLVLKDIKYHTSDASGGLIFIVKGDINIDPNVKQIDAVLIGFGSICTSFNGTCPTGFVSGEQLTINGSLISLNSSDPNALKLRRELADNTSAAEQVVYQPKYLAIFNDLLTDTFTLTAEY